MSNQQATKAGSRRANTSENRAFRGLFLVFLLTFLNLAGILLTAIGLNALDGWTTWQFVGLFGIVEAGGGLANVITPNLWAMPVVEQETSKRTRTVLALDILMMPHWGGFARSGAGIAMIVLAGIQEGFGPATALLPVLCVIVALLQISLSLLIARGGVERPDYDVLQITLNWYKAIDLPPISLSASALQFFLSLITIPAVTVIAPGAIFQPEIGPSALTLASLSIATVVATVLGLAAWNGRYARHAPREQLEEAEARA